MLCNEFNHKLPNVAIASFLCCFSFPDLSIEKHDGIGATVKQKKYQEKMLGRIAIKNAQQCT